MIVTYKIQPRVEFYFFGIFSRVFYDLIKETDSGDYQGNNDDSYSHEQIKTSKVLATYKSIEIATKELIKI